MSKRQKQSTLGLIMDDEIVELPSSSSVVHTRSKRSAVWNYFKKDEDKVICEVRNCGATFKFSNTTNLIHHLKHYHQINALKQTLVEDEAEVNPSETNTITTSTKNTTSQLSIRQFTSNKIVPYEKDSKRKKVLDNAVLKFIIKDLQPFSVVEDEGFVELLEEFDPRYKLPSRRFLRDNLLSKAYENAHCKIKEILQQAKNVSITFDGWTSRTTQSYLTLTVHFNNKKILETITLGVIPIPGRSTAQELKSLISEKFSHFPSLCIVCAITDHASNMLATCRELDIINIPCAAHAIQLVVNGAILSTRSTQTSEENGEQGLFDDNQHEVFENNTVYAVFKKSCRISAFFHRSSPANKSLTKEMEARNQKPIKLVQSVYTRWNSSYFMLESILKSIEAIVVVLSNIENNINLFSTTEKAMIPDILAILKPFVEATTRLSGESYASMSLIIPSVKQILTELDSCILTTTTGKNFAKIIRDCTMKRMAKYEQINIPSICTLLDPRFKSLGFISNSNYILAASKVKDELKSALHAKIQRARETAQAQISTETVETENARPKGGVFTFLNVRRSNSTDFRIPSISQAIIHFNAYLEDPILAEDTDIFKFWVDYTACEELKNIALKYLIAPATSVPSERTNSTAGNTISEKRSRLCPFIVEKLVFLKQNFKFVKNDLM